MELSFFENLTEGGQRVLQDWGVAQLSDCLACKKPWAVWSAPRKLDVAYTAVIPAVRSRIRNIW